MALAVLAPLAGCGPEPPSTQATSPAAIVIRSDRDNAAQLAENMAVTHCARSNSVPRLAERHVAYLRKWGTWDGVPVDDYRYECHAR